MIEANLSHVACDGQAQEGVQQDGDQAQENGTIAESSLVMLAQTRKKPECDGVLWTTGRAE